MDLLTLFAFTVAYVVAVLVPGPGVAAIVARALGGGFWSAVPMILGILVGDLLYLVFALFGLAAIATLFGPLFIIIRFASAAYLLYIAWQFWSAKPGKEQLGPRDREPWLRTFISGFALTLGNPKTIAFYLALLPTVIPLDQPITTLGFIELGMRDGATADTDQFITGFDHDERGRRELRTLEAPQVASRTM